MLFKKLLSTKSYYFFTGKYLKFLSITTIILFIIGLYWSLVIAPEDYQQGSTVRIMYVHVPAAWISLMTFFIMTVYSIVAIVFKIPSPADWNHT